MKPEEIPEFKAPFQLFPIIEELKTNSTAVSNPVFKEADKVSILELVDESILNNDET